VDGIGICRRTAAAMTHKCDENANTESTGEPFSSAEEAWIWACAAQRHRDEGGRIGRASDPPRCVDTIMAIASRLIAKGLLSRQQAETLQRFGYIERARPDPRFQRHELYLWEAGLRVIEPELLRRGIVRTP